MVPWHAQRLSSSAQMISSPGQVRAGKMSSGGALARAGAAVLGEMPRGEAGVGVGLRAGAESTSGI